MWWKSWLSHCLSFIISPGQSGRLEMTGDVNVIPTAKKGCKEDARICRPVSLILGPSKVLKQIIPETVSSHSVSYCLVKETNPQLSTTTLQEIVESDKVTSESPFLQAKHPQLPQSSFIWLVLQAPHQPRCPPLDMLKHLNVLPKLRGPELDTALKVWPHQCRVQGKNDLPAPAGHTIPDPGQDATGSLGHLGTLLAPV
ncbi:hypothetical protein DUI87_06993 [Hirundo rustica rustica]|uniref:Uncharacterized protein n=1 Tax=Hirundo rustica rustica TaxID=333673 RepID=A0A3M0L6G1_HIRRU|nr:hypothetical protein DUI87_06993 [Hirundo rustica rustica]